MPETSAGAQVVNPMELPIEEKVERVQRYQELGYFHPLTCRYCSEREDLLRPEARGDAVILVCPTCMSEQEMVAPLLGAILEIVDLPNPLEGLFSSSREPNSPDSSS